MPKIKFTKTEKKAQQDALKQYLRFLPTLQLKKQQLQNEVRRSAVRLDRNSAEQSELVERIRNFISLYAPEEDVKMMIAGVKIVKVNRSVENIAGLRIPEFASVEFAPFEPDLFATDWFVDDAVDCLRKAVSLGEERKVLAERHRMLSDELRVTSQRVNLFEKVKIPECRENIRRISIMLGDLDTSAVARCKIAKKKTAAAQGCVMSSQVIPLR